MSSLPGKTLYASGFNPRNIPGCALWLDAADRNTLTLSGTNISEWKDKSVNGLILSQATSSSQPTLGPLLNNLQTIQFTTAQSLRSTTNLLTNPAQTWFAVFNAYNNANNNRFWFNHSSNILATGGEYFFGGNGTMWANRKSGNLSQERAIIDSVGLGVTPFNSGQWYITGIVDSNTTTDITSFSFRINGSNRNISIYSTSSNILSGTANINVFINTQGPTANVYISEVIFYDAALTSNQIQTIEGYLASKWGLTSGLPATHPFKLYPVYTRPFQPIDISGCQLWYDANDSSTMTFSGSTVTQWNDKSGNGRNLTGVGSPVLQSYSNNMNVMLLNNSPYFQNTGFTNSGPYAIFIVFKFNSFPAWVTLLDNVSPLRPFVGYDAGAGLRVGSVRYGGSATTNVEIWSLQYSASDLTTFNVNGTSTIGNSTGYGGVGHTNGIRVGFAGNNTAPMVGWIGEIIYYGGTLSTSDRQAVEGYLADKWGLRGSLPATQPFKLFPPLTPVFTPNQISDCAVWLDAADRTTITLSGNVVTQWNDKSSSALVFTQSTVASRPTFTTTSVFGNSVYFTSSQSISSSNNLTLGVQQSWFFVFNSSDGRIFLEQSADTNTNNGTYFFGGNGTLYMIRRSGVNNSGIDSVGLGTTPFSANVSYVTSFVYNNTSQPVWRINGSARTINLFAGFTSVSGNAVDRLYINSRVTTNVFFSEILVFNSALSTAQIQLVEGYLAHKWGLLNSLPASHPYKKIRP